MYVYIYKWDQLEPSTDLCGYGYLFRNGVYTRICIIVEHYRPSIYASFNDISRAIDQKYGVVNEYTSKTFVKEVCGATTPVIAEKKRLMRLSPSDEQTLLKIQYESQLQLRGIVNKLNQHKIQYYDDSIPVVTKFLCDHDIDTHGWIQVDDSVTIEHYNTMSSVPIIRIDHDIIRSARGDKIPPPPKLTTLTVDIECYSPKDTFPDPNNVQNIIMTMCLYYMDPNIDKELKICIAVHHEEFQFDGILYICKDEKELLLCYIDLVEQLDPDVIVGFNSYKFDFTYISTRIMMCSGYFFQDDQSGRLIDHCARTEWSTFENATRSVRSRILARHGTVYLDVMEYAATELRVPQYSLNALSARYLNDKKDDMPVKDMFRAYREHDTELYTRVARYCMQDTMLTYRLLVKLNIMNFTISLGNITKTNMMDIYFRQTTTKIVNHLYSVCYSSNTIMHQEAVTKYAYTGAYVFEPEPNLYHTVAVADFKSLYPSIMIAQNISYDTYMGSDTIRTLTPYDDLLLYQKLVLDRYNSDPSRNEGSLIHEGMNIIYIVSVGNKKKNKQKRLDPVATTADINIGKTITIHRFTRRWKGILPALLEDLVNTRSKVKSTIAKLTKRKIECESTDDQLRLNDEILSLQAKEKALKISANSVYGCLGLEKPILLFMPGAASITAIGRSYILQATAMFKQMDCNVIYGDTDSCFVTPSPTIPNYDQMLSNPKLFGQYVKSCCKEISSVFPENVELDYEDVLVRIIILSQKVYVGITTDNEVKFKGTPNVKRNNSEFVRESYAQVVSMLMKQIDHDVIKKYLSNRIWLHINRLFPLEYYIEQHKYGSETSVKERPFVIKKDSSIEKRINNTFVRTFVKRMTEQGYSYNVGDSIELVVQEGPGSQKGLKAIDYKAASLDMLDRKYYLERLQKCFTKFQLMDEYKGKPLFMWISKISKYNASNAISLL